MKKLLPIIFILMSSFSIHAATYTVTRSDDRNGTCNPGVDCSLREAVKAANASSLDDKIDFISSLTTITLTKEIYIDKPTGSLGIIGAGANNLTIGGSGMNEIFYISVSTVTISGVTMTNGKNIGGTGGAIIVQLGSITLDGVNVKNNTTGLSFSSGGGIMLDGGSHRIMNSTISGNTAHRCGGISILRAFVVISNTTISGNSAIGSDNLSRGGGFCNSNDGINGNVILRNVTVTNNTSNQDAAGIISEGKIDFGNTIVAENNAVSFNSSFSEMFLETNSAISSGGNLFGDTLGDTPSQTFVIQYQPSDIRGVKPLLGILQNNGGPTPTHALLSGSPAIDKGSNFNSPAATDQRGFARIVGGSIDIGAVESETPAICTYTINVNPRTFTYSGGTGQITVSTQPGCSYSAFSLNSWLTVSQNMTGSATFNFTVATSTDGTARSGDLYIAGQGFAITQEARKGKRIRLVLF